MAILSAVFIIVAVTAVNDYMKEKQFVKLNRETETQQFIVVRAGRPQEIPPKALLVGDLLELNHGDIIPVDCLLVKGGALQVDESSITGESGLVKKSVLRAGDTAVDTAVDPFLVSDSRVMEGRGFGLVCSVGKHSVQGKTRLISAQVTEQEKTPLQGRLELIAEGLGIVGLTAGVFLALVLLGHTAFDALENNE